MLTNLKSVTHIFEGTFTQLLATVIGTLSAISDGMQYGWTAPVTPILLSEDSPIPTTKHEAEWLETILMLGACCGLPLTIYLVDKLGRKRSMILASSTVFFVWIVIAVSKKIEYILVARFFAGISGDMAFVAAPMYIAEIADEKIRGFLSSIIYLMMLTGVLLIYSIVPFVPFYVPSIIGGSLLLLEISIFPFMPDSPYYLLYKNKTELARESLQRLRQRKDVDKELKDISDAIERQREEGGRPLDLLLIPSNRKAIIIMAVLNASQHMSSISVMLMNLHTILDTAGVIHLSSSTAAILFSAVMFGAALSGSLVIDRFGRKVLLTISGIISGFSLLTLGGYFQLQSLGHSVEEISWIPVAAVLVYAAAFKFGIGLVPIVLTAELFPAKIKAIGMTVSDAMYVGFSVISLQIYQLLSNTYGMQVPFFVFAFCCFSSVIFALVFIPETKGKTLDEIQFILKGKAAVVSDNTCINS